MQDRRNVISDPDRLLDALKEHLTEAGGIHQKSICELIKLMSDTNGKLVPKCISLCIISASENDVQAQICQGGAWDILLKWLQEALKEDNHSFLLELMSVYLSLPVRLDQLTQNVCPKLINSLSKKSENKDVRSLACDIVKKWKDVISRDRRRDSNSNLEPPIKKQKIPTESEKKELVERESDSSIKDIKKRRSTVKMPATIMRTAGIEDSDDQFVPKSRAEVLAKKNRQDSGDKESIGLPIESFHQKITVTPTEPKKSPHEIFESSNFINALTQPIVRKKRKLPKVETINLATASVNDNVEVKDPNEIEVDEPVVTKSPPSDSETPKKSALASFSAFAVDKKPKKRVTWAPEERLQDVSFFEVDETERVNVTRVSLAEIRQKELNLEREMFKRHDEIEIKDAKWQTPVSLELTVQIDPGSKSVERQIQLERERRVLQTIYFSKDTVPISPEEPEKEEFEAKLAIEIPLEDLHTKEPPSENEDLLIMNDKGDGKAQMSLNPEVADLVKSLAFNYNTNVEIKSSLVPMQSYSPAPPIITSSSGMQIIPFCGVTSDEVSEPFDPKYSETSMSINISSDHEHISDNYSLSPPHEHHPNMIAPPFMPDMNGQMPPNLRCPPPGPHRPPMPGDMRGPFPPNHHPHFSPDRLPLGHPHNFGARHTGPPPPFRGPPPHMFPGARPAVNIARGNGRSRGGGQICKFFQQGHCRHSNNCHFLHPGYSTSPGWG